MRAYIKMSTRQNALFSLPKLASWLAFAGTILLGRKFYWGLFMTDVNQLKTMTHQTLIDLIHTFTPAMPADRGVCNGFTSMWIQAVSTDEEQEAHFYHRLDGLSYYLSQPNASITTLKNQVDALYESQKKSSSAPRKTLTKQDLWLIDIHAFARSTALQQDANNLGVFPETVLQQNKTRLYGLTASSALEKKGLKIKEDRIGSMGADRNTLVHYVNAIKSALEKEYENNPADKKISFLLGSGYHSIGFYLNPSSGTWHYMDINKLSENTQYYFSVDSESLADHLFDSLNENGPHTIFTLSCLSTWHSERLVTCLRLINQSFLPDSISKVNHKGENALQLSCLYGENSGVKTLLEAGEKVTHLGRNKRTALMLAAMHGHTRTVETVLDTKRKCQPTFFSAQHALEFCTNLLEDNLNSVDEYGDSALMLAATHGFTDVVNLLMHRGANATLQNNLGYTALMLAAKNGQTRTVEALIHPKKDAATLMFTFQNAFEPFNLFSTNTLDAINTKGNTALMLAALNGHINVVKILISKQANINLQNKQGNTALMLAAQSGHANIIELLLVHGATINAINNAGETALTQAKQNNDGLAAQTLILHGGCERKSWTAWLMDGLPYHRSRDGIIEQANKRAKI
jgi:ankyrin repeat protein